MARPLRDIDPGTFHLTCHSVRDTALFRDDLDRIRFLTELAAVSAREGWTCIEYCLMTTHFHLIVGVDAGVLPVAMHQLNFRYAGAFNARHGTRGHVLEGRYNAGRIGSDAHTFLLRTATSHATRWRRDSRQLRRNGLGAATPRPSAWPIRFPSSMRRVCSRCFPGRARSLWLASASSLKSRDGFVTGPGPGLAPLVTLANGREMSYV